GAGPTGLTAALVLLRNGINVRIVEKLPSFNPGSRGPGLQPRTLELFHQARLHDIIEAGQPFTPIRSYKPGTMEPDKVIAMGKTHAPTPHYPYVNGLVLGQHMTERLLREHIAKYNVHVELGTELRSFEQNADYVTVQLVKKQQGSEEETVETMQAQYLIGAEGARSAVRKGLGCTFLGETRDETRMITGDVRVVGEGLGRDHFHRFGEVLKKR
ncbi:FAD-binding monooxygenase, partial [Coniophora puteana RWD-64-598 SS2]